MLNGKMLDLRKRNAILIPRVSSPADITPSLTLVPSLSPYYITFEGLEAQYTNARESDHTNAPKKDARH